MKEKQVTRGSEAVGIVDEVVTRWWASFDAAERMMRLKPAIEAMHFNNEIDQEKCPELLTHDWHQIKEIMDCLKAFKDAQKHLEGQKCVTASTVTASIHIIRKGLKEIVEGEVQGARLLDLNLLSDFNQRWKSETEPVFEVSGKPLRTKGNRQKGIHPIFVLPLFSILKPSVSLLSLTRFQKGTSRIMFLN